MTFRPFVCSIGLLALLAVATACDGKAAGESDAGSSAGGGSGVEPGLEGRTFLLDSIEGYTLEMGTTVRVTFSDGQISFNAGCNTYGGSYRLEDGQLVVENLSSTLIGCTAELEEQDQWLSEFFSSSPTVDLDGADLTLSSQVGTLQLLDREVADPDRALVGPTWTVTTLLFGPVAQGGFAGEPTVTFNDRGQVLIFTGCNTGGGEYSVSGLEITLSGMAYTEEGCADADINATERHIQRVLKNGTVAFEIDAAQLTLMNGSLGVIATTD